MAHLSEKNILGGNEGEGASPASTWVRPRKSPFMLPEAAKTIRFSVVEFQFLLVALLREFDFIYRCVYSKLLLRKDMTIMEKSEIFENAIRELTEEALRQRKENMGENEKQLYAEARALSSQAQEIVQSLPEEQQRILTDYFVKTNLIADHDCQHLYVQGAKDCVELLKKLGAL